MARRKGCFGCCSVERRRRGSRSASSGSYTVALLCGPRVWPTCAAPIPLPTLGPIPPPIQAPIPPPIPPRIRAPSGPLPPVLSRPASRPPVDGVAQAGGGYGCERGALHPPRQRQELTAVVDRDVAQDDLRMGVGWVGGQGGVGGRGGQGGEGGEAKRDEERERVGSVRSEGETSDCDCPDGLFVKQGWWPHDSGGVSE